MYQLQSQTFCYNANMSLWLQLHLQLQQYYLKLRVATMQHTPNKGDNNIC